MTTENYSLGQPAEGSLGWDKVFETNFRALETEMATTRTNQREAQVNVETAVRTEFQQLGYNMGFHYWQRGTNISVPSVTGGFGPDMWKLDTSPSGAGLIVTVARASGETSFNNDYACRVTPLANAVAEVYNIIPHVNSKFYKFCIGKEMTFAIDTKKEDANTRVRAFIRDGVGTTYSSDAAVNTTKNRLVVTRTIAAGATKLEVGMHIDDSPAGAQNGYYVECANTALTFGNLVDVPYIPINPQDDFFGCALVYQVLDFDVGWYNLSADVTMKSTLFFPCPMVSLPTATVTKGTETKGTLASIGYTPVNNLGGYITAVGSTKTNRLLKVTGNILKLEVT